MEDMLQIQQTIARFANSFDVKDWDGLQACFTETFRADYSDLNGTPPQIMNAADYVKSRRESLARFKLHHLVSNYEIDFADSNSAACRASMIVWRKADGEESASHYVYLFQLTKQDSEWKIGSVTQKVLWNEGERR